MSFLAGFLGSQAETHGETSREWKRMWQQDQALQLQQEQIRLQDQQQAAMLQYNQDRLAFDRERTDDELELDWAQFNADQTHRFFTDTVTPEFSSLSKSQQIGLYEGLSAQMGDNEFAGTYLTGLYNSINSGLMDEANAVAVLEQYLNPKLDAQGNPVSISEPMVNMAMRSLKESGSEYYNEFSANWDALKEATDETRDELTQAWLTSIHNTNLVSEAQANDFNASAGLKGAQAEHTSVETSILSATKEDLIQQVADATAMGTLNLQDERTRSGFLEDMLTAALTTAQNEAVGTELANDGTRIANEVAAALADPTVRAAMAEAGIRESDLNVAYATVNARIRAANLTVDELAASIKSINTATDLSIDARNMAKFEVLSELAANGRTDLLKASAMEHLAGFPEDAREELYNALVNTSESEGTYIERMRNLSIDTALANIGKEKAQAMLFEVQAETIPLELQAQIDQWAEANRQGDERLAEEIRSNMAREGIDIAALAQRKAEADASMSLGWAQLNETVRSNKAKESISVMDIQSRLAASRGNSSMAGEMNTVDAMEFATDRFSDGDLWAANRVAELGTMDSAQAALTAIKEGGLSQGSLNALEGHLNSLGITLPDVMRGDPSSEELASAISIIENNLVQQRTITEGLFASEIALFSDSFARASGRSGTEGLLNLGIDLDSIDYILKDAADLTFGGQDNAMVSRDVVDPLIPLLLSDLAVNVELGTIFDEAIMDSTYEKLLEFVTVNDDREAAEGLLARAGVTSGSDMKDVLELEYRTAQGMSTQVYTTMDRLGVTGLDLSTDEGLSRAVDVLVEELDAITSVPSSLSQTPAGSNPFSSTARAVETSRSQHAAELLGMSVDEAEAIGIISRDRSGNLTLSRENLDAYIRIEQEGLLSVLTSATTLYTKYGKGFARSE